MKLIVDSEYLLSYKKLVETYGYHLSWCSYKDCEFCDCGFSDSIKKMRSDSGDMVKRFGNKNYE